MATSSPVAGGPRTPRKVRPAQPRSNQSERVAHEEGLPGGMNPGRRPDFSQDDIVSFTLSVDTGSAALPEPSSLFLFGSALAGGRIVESKIARS